MEQITIVERQILAFTYSEDMGIWVSNSNPSLFLPEPDVNYLVLWGSETYSCTAFVTEAVPGNILLGNPMPLGGADNGLPFLMSSLDDGSGMSIMTFDPGETREFAVYQAEAGGNDEPTGIPTAAFKLKNYAGDYRFHEQVPKIWLHAPDSTEENPVRVPYTYGEALEGVEVIPDFSAGDQEITLPEGYMARSAVVKKPAELVPENIKKGETVAGIPGAYEGEPPETETLTLAADFSVGDMIVRPTGEKYLAEVTVEKPDTLIPENIAKGVEIAGVCGEHEGGGGGEEKVLVPFFASGSKTGSGSYSSTSGTLEASVVIPSTAEIFNVQTCGSVAQNTTSIPSSVAAPLSNLTNGSYTRAATETELTLTYKYTWGGTNRYYKVVSAYIFVIYFIPGITIESDQIGNIVRFGKEVTLCPAGPLPNRKSLVEARLSESSIASIPEKLFYNNSTLERAMLPGTLETIGNYAFYYCTKLKSINMPNRLISIGTQAFYYCSALEVIDLPDGLETIGANAFRYCKAVSEITLPDGLASIGNYAFGNCTALKLVDCTKCSNIPSLGSNAFYSYNSAMEIKVPENLYEEWVAATGWSTYSSIIIPV